MPGLVDAWCQAHARYGVLSLATVVVFARGTSTRNAIGVQLSRLRGAQRLLFVEMPRIDVSATMVRRRAAEGKPIRYLVPDKVANYIGAQSLYGASAPAPTSA